MNIEILMRAGIKEQRLDKIRKRKLTCLGHNGIQRKMLDEMVEDKRATWIDLGT